MNELTVFTYDNQKVRTVLKDGEPWWVAKDVAEILGYQKFDTHLLDKVPVEWKDTKQIRTPGGEQDMLCLSEPGLYFFLARSDKPAALPFQKWIAGEVIPSIRKTGSYHAAPALEAADTVPLEAGPHTAPLIKELTRAFDKGLLSPAQWRAALGISEDPPPPPVPEAAELIQRFTKTLPQGGKAQAQHLYDALKQWAHAHGFRCPTQQVASRLFATAYRRSASQGLLYYHGLSLPEAPV
jgi:prophage antirepressor-like protein